MDIRYQHPQITSLWSLQWTYATWWRIEQAAMRVQLGGSKEGSLFPLGHPSSPDFGSPGVLSEIEKIEARTKHDVAAFLEYVRSWIGAPYDRWIHIGLTSSDVVDTAQGIRFNQAYPTLLSSLDDLTDRLFEWQVDDSPILGRTHGQPAEPMSLGMRAEHWAAMFNDSKERLRVATLRMARGKLSGPVGNYAHNRRDVETKVMHSLGLVGGIGGSQIVPRHLLADWANCASLVVSVCAKIAMDLRLMRVLGEAVEHPLVGQVGSSSMAHKSNPIRAEKITGLQRVAAAYASMLQPLDVWLERDISNSSVERIAVPDLWHVLLHVVEETTSLLASTHVGSLGLDAIEAADGAPYVHRATLEAIRDGASPEGARIEAMRRYADGELKAERDAGWFTRNWDYPEGD